jgi:flagellar protein FlaJ
VTFYKDSINYFSSLGMRYLPNYLKPLKEEMKKSNLSILFEVYVGRMILFTFFSFFISFIAVTFILTIFYIPPIFTLIGAFAVGGSVAVGVLTFFHSYPFQLITSKKNSIDGNMPFAISHMSAIASSGVPPYVIFKLLSTIKEYGEIANESKRIVRNVELFGMDFISAIKNVGDRTPSTQFKQFLYGIISTTETGGSLQEYMDNASREALFDYKLKREKYLQTLSTYADFYTAVLIAAPLFFVSVLSILSLIGGQIFGLDIPTAMKLGIYVVIPLLNTAFIMFIHYTQPKV